MIWWRPLVLTLQLIAGSVLLSGLLGMLGAWAADIAKHSGRTGRFASNCFFVCMVTALAMPLVLHATAWEATAGKFGWLSMTQTGARSYTGLAGHYSGMVACVWVHGLFGAALVALSVGAGAAQIPTSILQQARLEMGHRQCWWRVQVPMAAPWWTLALLATAALAASEMTVADLYGVRTLADEFYLYYSTEPNITAILRTLVLPVAFSVACVLVWLVGRRRHVDWHARQANRPRKGEEFDWQFGGVARLLAILTILFCILLITVVPTASLIVKVGHSVEVTVDANGDSVANVSWSLANCVQRLFDAPSNFASEYQWTLIIAAGMAICCVPIAWPVVLVGRRHPRLVQWFDAFSIVVFLIPGPIVGLAVTYLFSQDIVGFRTLYQQTLIPTFVSLSFRSVPVCYWILRSGYQQIGADVDAAAKIDFSPLQKIWRVDSRFLIGSLVACLLAVAVVATGDVPATLPVIPPGVTTVGTRLFSLLHSGARYQEAALAVWYVLAVVLVAAILSRQSLSRR